jgi:hypothetical protein
MIRTLFILATMAILSCNSNSKPTTESAEASIDFKSLSAPVPFAGSWISASYLKSIVEHQSPRKAQEGSGDVFIRLPETTLKTASMIHNFHEAITDLVVINRSGTFELWEKQNDTLSNAKYTIEKIAEDTIRIGEKTFIKINTDLSGDQSRILESILFSGVYTNKKGGQVEFKSNGEVSGLGKYKYYLPMLDYFDAGLDVDQVGLGETPEKMEYFGFKFKKDKLDIYTLKCKEVDPVDKRCVVVDFGQKAYELEKQ